MALALRLRGLNAGSLVMEVHGMDWLSFEPGALHCGFKHGLGKPYTFDGVETNHGTPLVEPQAESWA